MARPRRSGRPAIARGSPGQTCPAGSGTATPAPTRERDTHGAVGASAIPAPPLRTRRLHGALPTPAWQRAFSLSRPRRERGARFGLCPGAATPRRADEIGGVLTFWAGVWHSISNRWGNSRAGLSQRWALLAHQGSFGRANATYHVRGRPSGLPLRFSVKKCSFPIMVKTDGV